MGANTSTHFTEHPGLGLRKRRKEERPGQILDAALAEFAEKGYAAARLEDVARRVGVTKGTLYLYFPTKADLFKAVISTCLLPVFEMMNRLSEEHSGTATELLRRQIEMGYTELTRDPASRELLRLLISDGSRVPEIVSFYVNDILGHASKGLRAVLERGVETGEFRADTLEKFGDFPDIIIAPTLMLNIVFLMLGDNSKIDVERYIAAHADLILNGLKAPSAATKANDPRAG